MASIHPLWIVLPVLVVGLKLLLETIHAARVRAGAGEAVAVFRNGELRRVLRGGEGGGERSWRVPILDSQRRITTRRQRFDVEPVSVETSDGCRVTVSATVHYTVEDVERYLSADRTVEEDLRPELPGLVEDSVRGHYPNQIELPAVQTEISDEIARGLPSIPDRYGVEMVRVSTTLDEVALPSFYPYIDTFDRDADGTLYLDTDGGRRAVEDIFYGGSNDVLDLKLLDVPVETVEETVTVDGEERTKTHTVRPDDPRRTWMGYPKFDEDGEPYTVADDGTRVQLTPLLRSVPGRRMDLWLTTIDEERSRVLAAILGKDSHRWTLK